MHFPQVNLQGTICQIDYCGAYAVVQAALRELILKIPAMPILLDMTDVELTLVQAVIMRRLRHRRRGIASPTVPEPPQLLQAV